MRATSSFVTLIFVVILGVGEAKRSLARAR
jgi:hypothetical protein